MGSKNFLIDNKKLLEKWDYNKNSNINIEKVTIGSNKYAYWLCTKGHSYYATIKSQASGCGCNICAGKVVLRGFNDFETWCKSEKKEELLNEWDYVLNESAPEDYCAKSGKKVWWKCQKCGKSWLATIHSRSFHNTACPNCSSSKQTSFPEQALYYYIKKIYNDTENRYVLKDKFTIDIFIKSDLVGIEYDGYAWHRSSVSQKREKIKEEICQSYGIRLIRVKEVKDDNEVIIKNDTIYYYRDKNDNNLNQVIGLLFSNVLKITIPDIDVARDKLKIYELYNYVKKERSILDHNQNIAKEWDYEKNKPMTPESVSYMSNEYAWWICSKKHSFKMKIFKRMQGQNCPYCSNRKILPGFNDFETWCKKENKLELLSEWDFDLNRKLPSEVFRGNKSIFCWVCPKCGCKWNASILSRAHGYNNCPHCSGKTTYRKVIKLESDDKVIEEYKSLSEAARVNNLSLNKMKKICENNDIFKGYKWSYK